jgi:hypothetical protein
MVTKISSAKFCTHFRRRGRKYVNRATVYFGNVLEACKVIVKMHNL